MRRRSLTLTTAILVALALAIPAGADELHEPHQGTMCKDGGLVQLHFVQNQIPLGAEAGWIYVTFADGTTVSKQADKVNRRNQHWTINVDHESQLKNAWTTIGTPRSGPSLEGKLVLSDYDCKKAPPPKK